MLKKFNNLESWNNILLSFLGFWFLSPAQEDKAQETVKPYIVAHNEPDVENALPFTLNQSIKVHDVVQVM